MEIPIWLIKAILFHPDYVLEFDLLKFRILFNFSAFLRSFYTFSCFDYLKSFHNTWCLMTFFNFSIGLLIFKLFSKKNWKHLIVRRFYCSIFDTIFHSLINLKFPTFTRLLSNLEIVIKLVKAIVNIFDVFLIYLCIEKLN